MIMLNAYIQLFNPGTALSTLEILDNSLVLTPMASAYDKHYLCRYLEFYFNTFISDFAGSDSPVLGKIDPLGSWQL